MESTFDKTLNCYLSPLKKTDAKRLFKYGWIKSEDHRPGFMRTTSNFDDQTAISTSPKLVIDDLGYEYLVAFVSGCFYPIWYRAYRAGSQPINLRTAYKLKNGKVESVCAN